MSLEKYVSSTKDILWGNDIVYSKLSNFETLKLLFNPENLEKAKGAMGKDASKLDIKDFEADRDSCSFKVGSMGRFGVKIIEREEGKMIKISGDDSTPFEMTMWVQLLPVNSVKSKMRLTIHAELSMMMKMVVGKKLKKGIDQIADAIAMIPYGNIPSPEGTTIDISDNQ